MHMFGTLETMKVFVIIGGVVVLGGIVSLVLMYTEPKVTNYPPQNSTIVAFGDSLVAGQGAGTGRDFVSLLSAKLGRQIVNLGVSGNTSADGIARMKEVINEKPGVVILLLGGNDFLQRTGAVAVEENLSTLISTFQKHGAVVVLVGVRSGILSSNSGEIYERLSERYGTILVDDVLAGIFLKPNLMSDAIHPNDAGYALIAERLYREVFEEYNL